jgi:hypothetical protein
VHTEPALKTPDVRAKIFLAHTHRAIKMSLNLRFFCCIRAKKKLVHTDYALNNLQRMMIIRLKFFCHAECVLKCMLHVWAKIQNGEY